MTKHLDSPSLDLDRQTWRQILTAAKDLLLDRGYRGVSMREIADAVQVTPAALYYHFPQGKEDLFARMIQTLFVDEGMADLDRALGTAPDPDLRERLTRLTAALLMLPLDEHMSMLLRDAREHLKDPQSQRIILSLRDRIRQQHTWSRCCWMALRLPRIRSGPDAWGSDLPATSKRREVPFPQKGTIAPRDTIVSPSSQTGGPHKEVPMSLAPDPLEASQAALATSPAPGSTPAIATHGLSKHFGQRTAVDGLTITIPAGTIAHGLLLEGGGCRLVA